MYTPVFVWYCLANWIPSAIGSASSEAGTGPKPLAWQVRQYKDIRTA